MSGPTLEQLPDGVVVIDADLRITTVSSVALEVLCHEEASLVGARLDEALDPRARDGTPLLDGGWHPSASLPSVQRIPVQDVIVRTADRGAVRVSVTGRYQRDEDGRLLGVVLSIRDAERESRRNVSGIEVVSTVSHELRSPLTSVKGFTSLLLNRWDRLADDKKKEMLGQVQHDADRVTRLVNELLDISRLETGRLVLRRSMVDLGPMAQSVVDKVALQYSGLDCTVEVPDSVPQVYADPDKVEQVLTNLVENAAKYGSLAAMKVAAAANGDEVTISVSDNGEGIPAHDLHRVFRKFYRRDHGRPTGSGLGLWISRGLVEAHGGELTATSSMGSGSTFAFTLPLGAFEALHGDDAG